MRSFILSCSDACISIEQTSLFVKCRDALIIGHVPSLELIIADSLIIVGHGKLNVALTDRLIAISRDAPLTLNNVYGRECFLSGSKYPVLISRLRCLDTYLRKCLVNDLQTSKAIIGDEVVIKNLCVEQELVFNDPYVWFEKLNVKQDAKMVFNYDKLRRNRNEA